MTDTAKPFYKGILTVLSVIFCLREAILSASIGDSSNSERSSTALSRSLEQNLNEKSQKKESFIHTFDYLRTTACGSPLLDNMP